MYKKQILFLMLLAFAATLLLCSCKRNDTTKNPTLQNYTVHPARADQNGNFIEVELEYDREVLLQKNAADNILVVLDKQQIEPKDISLELSEHNPQTVLLHISAGSASGETISISHRHKKALLQGIVSKSGLAPSVSPKINCLVPSEILLNTLQKTTGTNTTSASVQKQILGSFREKGVMWVQLILDGRPVKPLENKKAEQQNYAIAVRCAANTSSAQVAQSLAQALNTAFDGSYSTTFFQDTVMVQTLKSGDGELDLLLYLQPQEPVK